MACLAVKRVRLFFLLASDIFAMSWAWCEKNVLTLHRHFEQVLRFRDQCRSAGAGGIKRESGANPGQYPLL